MALAGEHGVAHPLALGERTVKGFNKTARGFHQQAVAHRHHRGHAHLEQGRGHTLGGLASLGALAGIEADQRDAVIAQQWAELVAENRDMPALLQLAAVVWALEAEPAEAHARVIHAVAVEVDHVIRPLLVAGALQFGPQGGQRRRAEQMELDQARQCLRCFHQRQGTGAVVDVAAGIVIGPRRDQQDADRRGNHGHAEALGARQAPPDPRRLGALEEVAAAVVQQFPGQAEQERGGFAGFGGFAGDGDFGLGRTGPGTIWLGCAGIKSPGFERCIHLHGEATPGLGADPRPGIHHVRGVGQGQCRGVQQLAPLHEFLLNLLRPAFEIGARPDRVLLQIPAQVARFERPDRRH